jgi:hypothetical protein
MMLSVKILVVKMGGGYLKAILPSRDETVFGRDYGELIGRLKLIGIREPALPFPGRKRTA